MKRILPSSHKQKICYSTIHRSFSSWSVDAASGIVSTKTKGSPRFQTVIGLEIHAQLDIPTKLFSGCPISKTTSSLYKPPNTSVWPFDVGVPGMLPRLSLDAVRAAVLSAAATKCTIPSVSRFERKHYFYADLPLGYQVTQQRWPIAREGILICQKEQSKKKKKKKGIADATFSTRIERIQLEQDTGKTIMTTRNGVTESLVDFNRAGYALIEIVFYPDIRSASDAAIAVETLRNLLRHIGTCDGKMEEGSLRCDLNVSIAPIIDDQNNIDEDNDEILALTGNRVEVKNLNSIRQVQQAATYEAIRQAEAFTSGKPTGQETRTFDIKSGKTIVIRSKEGAKDYRFMPEPDLPPVELTSEVFGGMDIESFIERTLPELPQDARKRLQQEYKLSDYLAGVLIGDPPAITMFDVAVLEARKQVVGEKESRAVPETAANLLCNGLFAIVRENEVKIKEELGEENSVKFSNVDGEQLGELVALLVEGTISNTMAKQILRILHEEEKGKKPRQVVEERGIKLITAEKDLAKICHAVISSSPKEMERYKLGGKFVGKIKKFLLGKAMATSKGNAHPERLNEVLSEVLDEVAPLDE